jgi:hypothetical protein
VLFRELIEDLERDTTAPVEHYDPGRNCGIAFEEASFLPLLGIVCQLAAIPRARI